MEEILKRIPQRAPFLFIENIVDRTDDMITTSQLLTGKEDFFAGHFPGNPVFPGVLMCEACFQTGALLMSYKGESSNDASTALVTRIQNTKFRNLAKPGDNLMITVSLKEMMANAAFMKGKITVDNKTIMTIDFTCAIVGNEGI